MKAPLGSTHLSIVLWAALLSPPGALWAQEILPTPEEAQPLPQAEEVPAPTKGVDEHSRFQALLREVAEQRKKLGSDVRSLATGTPDAEPEEPPSPPRILRDIQRDLHESDELREERLSQLKEQLKQWEASSRRARDCQAAEDTSPISVPAVPAAKIDPVPSPTPPKTTPRAKDKPKPPQVVVDGPADSLALADSLYASGETHLALEIYQKLAQGQPKPVDQRWIDYQIAGCHRRLGKLAEAQKAYRLIAGATDAEFLADSARWWLDAIERRMQFQQRFEKLHSALQAAGEPARE